MEYITHLGYEIITNDDIQYLIWRWIELCIA